MTRYIPTKDWTKEEALKRILIFYEKHKRLPNKNDYYKMKFIIKPSVLQKLFEQKTWEKTILEIKKEMQKYKKETNPIRIKYKDKFI